MLSERYYVTPEGWRGFAIRNAQDCVIDRYTDRGEAERDCKELNVAAVKERIGLQAGSEARP